MAERGTRAIRPEADGLGRKASAVLTPSERDEWLETDGLGGFASGTTLGLNTRRYHGLLVTARVPPAGRHVLVNDAVVWLESPSGRRALSSHRYLPDWTALGD